MKSILPSLVLLLMANVAVAQQATSVSMIQLIANPKAFDGHEVRVVGFLRLEYEGDALYLHEQDFKRGIPSNGVAIDPSDVQRKQFGKLNNRYVLVEGTFSASERGHFGAFPGTLQKITRLNNWSVVRK